MTKYDMVQSQLQYLQKEIDDLRIKTRNAFIITGNLVLITAMIIALFIFWK